MDAADAPAATGNKMTMKIIVAAVVIIVLGYLFLFKPPTETGGAGGEVPKITSQGDAGKALSNLTSDVGSIGSVLQSLDNNIG